MRELIEYVVAHTERGECQCGKCVDKKPDREPTGHSVSVVLFWVSARNEPKAAELLALLRRHYPDVARLQKGLSYIEIGGVLGGQDAAMRLLGLGELVGLWSVITPATIGFGEEQAMELAESGLVYNSPWGEASGE